ncbi:DedA family protein [Paenibacillus sp. GYB003]|uniref:DedA family protein n=1 Tax=Paenibacillus sp. GYB003 TaxID=2994392 RepID=UPI002F9621FD
MEWMNALFEQYGYYLLFFGLFAESLALPFPGELAMALSGHSAYLGTSSLPLDMLSSYTGAVIGTVLTYTLGRRLGTPFFETYGKYVFLSRERIDKLAAWFGKYGNKLILVSYFVPGLRHFTGYVSGILNVRRGAFLLYTHLGALVWVIFYVSIGRIFGPQLEQLLHTVSAYSWRALVFLTVGIAVLLVKKHRAKLLKEKERIEARQDRSECAAP